MIKNAKFVSKWSNGVVISKCKVNTDTNEVFDIDVVDFEGDVLEKEYIEIDSVEYPVFQISDITEEDDEYWYE